MPLAPADRRLLLVHAHPDDEVIGTGATMARYAAEGARVVLVTCTLGELGEVLVPELAHLAHDREGGLGQHRIGELDAAMRALDVDDHRFLGGAGRFQDSGMMGEPTNERPEAFWQADVEQAAALLAEVVREVRPQVVVTYDANGFYGHPDHIQAHRVTLRAVELAAEAGPGGEPWQVAKVYATAIPRSQLAAGIEAMKEAGSDFFGVTSVEELPFGSADEDVTAEVDGEAYVERKLAGMRAHATQIAVDGPFFALSNNIGQQALGREFFTLLRGERGPGSGPHHWETDLFAGL